MAKKVKKRAYKTWTPADSERAEKALSREDARGQDRENDEAQRGHRSDEGLSARILRRPSSPESSLTPISDVRANHRHGFS